MTLLGQIDKSATVDSKIATAKAAALATAAADATTKDAVLAANLAGKADLVGGLVPTSQIPALALNTSITVASQAAMLALTATQVQPGDLAIRTDGAGTFILTATDPSQLANWTRLNAPTDVVTTVNGQIGTVVLAKADVGLGSVDNTSDLAKPVSTATSTALAGKKVSMQTQATQTASFTAAAGNFYPVNAAAGNVTVTLPATNVAGQEIQLKKLDASVLTGSPTGIVNVTGTINGTPGATIPLRKQGMGKQYLADGAGGWTIVLGDIDITQLTKADVGLGNVDNTSDAIKPVSSAQQAALDGKPDATLVTSIWRPVGSGAMPVFSTVTASGSLTGGTGVKRIHNGPNPLTALRVVYGNYITNAAEASTGYGTRTIVAASVEYPSGTFTPISFRGGPGGSYSAGFDVTSDDVAVSIPPNTDFWIRTYETWTAGTNIPLQNMPNQLGQSSDLSATPTDKTQTAGNAGFQSVGITPIQVLGRVPITSRCLYVAGDSITTGTGDNYDYSRGYVTMATDGVVDVQKVSAPSTRTQGDAIASGRWRKSRLMNGATAAYEAYGINDIANSRTLVQLQADKVNVWLWLAAVPGIRKVYSGTLVPYAPTSTDGWTTASGQTISAYEAVRTGFNSWIRDGAPLASTSSLVAVGVGATGTTIRAGQAGHPLTGYVEIAATVEVNSSNVLTLNGGFWKVPTTGRTVTDAAMSSGTRVLTSATAAFTSADVGRVVTVAGAGAAGALYIGGIASVQSATQVTMNAPYSLAAGTTVSGATANIGKSWTQEGLHPGTEAHAAMAVALAAALPTITA